MNQSQALSFERPTIRVFVLPGGTMPVRQTAGAVGFDAHARAIVSPTEMDPKQPHLRKTIFDFVAPPENPEEREHVVRAAGEGPVTRPWVWSLKPGEHVLIGIGVVFELDPTDPRWFFWVAPRSGLAAKHGVTVGNTPGTVDCDYRGEAGIVLINQGKKPFLIHGGMRVGQLIFQRSAEIPIFQPVEKYEDLSTTTRGVGGFGSTGA